MSTAFLAAARRVAALLCAISLGFSMAAVAAPRDGMFPREVEAALARAKVPHEAVTLLVADAEGERPPRLAWRSQEKMNPASVMKLITTFAGLDLLGPTYTWRTPVYVDGAIRNDVLEGNLYIKGQGDPKLVIERLLQLLQEVRAMGIRRITGDIVLDRSAFDTGAHDPSAFDGQPLRPYNVGADALLVNFKAVQMTFTPDVARRVAHVDMTPVLAGVTVPATVPLLATDGHGCGDWRTQLHGNFQAAQFQFSGGYPAGCAEGTWLVAYPDPGSFAARTIAGQWAQMGGQLQGTVREGLVPEGLEPAFESRSPPLADVVRDINKYSNNVMADQLFLTLGLTQKRRGTFPAARATLRQWWNMRIGTGEGQPVFDNGSGLSMDGRLTAAGLARMLQVAWRSPVMPELVSSLSVVGVDGTLRRRRLRSGATAHLKSGTMPDYGVAGVAGYVEGASGRRYVVVAIANHVNAAAARPAFDALVDWTARD